MADLHCLWFFAFGHLDGLRLYFFGGGVTTEAVLLQLEFHLLLHGLSGAEKLLELGDLLVLFE